MHPAVIAAIVVAGAFFFLPGFHYAYADKDPGVYVAHGFAIAREGDVEIDDLVVQRQRLEFPEAGQRDHTHDRRRDRGAKRRERLQQAVINNDNVFAVLMDAVRVCSLGQITNALFEVGGQYRRNM